MLRHAKMSAQYSDHDLVDEDVKASGIGLCPGTSNKVAEGEVAPTKEYRSLGKGVGDDELDHKDERCGIFCRCGRARRIGIGRSP